MSHLPQVIAHRGASGHRPEHTRSAYELGFRLGADSIELDLVATADGVLVCRHDVELSRTTDIADRPEFADRVRTLFVEGRPVTGWFVHDLTAAELGTLRCLERWPRKRAASARHDGAEPVLRFAEALEIAATAQARSGRRLSVHAELKSPGHLAGHGLWLPELLAGTDLSGVPVTWMSFDVRALRALDLPGPRIRLFRGTPGRRALRAATEFSGIGVRRRVALPRNRRGGLATGSVVAERARALGLQVLVWTHRAENKHLPPALRLGDSGHAHGDAVGEARLFYEAGVDGVISDFPELAVMARDQVLAQAARAVG